jgi:hypothetical protein
MKQTATEWLFQRLWETPIDKLTWYAILEQATAMEKEQIKDAHINGFYSPPFRKSRNGEAEEYYNETFKSE